MKTDLITSSFENYLNSLLNDFEDLKIGDVADYIPELTKVDPDFFGISIVTVEGQVYQAGDRLNEFTIQSISKPFVYGIALEENGIDQVIRKVDVEPSGEAFNEISLEDDTGRPRNPMINAGAIATTGLVPGMNSKIKVQNILDKFNIYAGHSLEIDTEVYKSESSTGHRNRAIAYLLRNSNILDRDPEPILDAYFQQCSILVNCRDLALMGATLANNGVHPITGMRAVKEEYVSKVLSVMTSSGMYDYSGAWLFEVGMPAKSGVSGGVLAVLPGQLALAVYSPRLDHKGNSVRGLAVCKKISNDFGLHMLRTTAVSESSVIRNIYDATKVRSKHFRRREEIKELDNKGSEIKVIELSGELRFTTSDIVTSNVLNNIADTRFIIIDFAKVSSIDKAAINILFQLFNTLMLKNITVLLTKTENKFNFLKQLKLEYDNENSGKLKRFANIDEALEYCENIILDSYSDKSAQNIIAIEDNDLFTDFEADEIEMFKKYLTTASYKKDEIIISKGDNADKMYFIISGQVKVSLTKNKTSDKHLAILSAGSSFGELAIIEKRKDRSAYVIADSEVQCAILNFNELEKDNNLTTKVLTLKLVSNISRMLFERLNRSNEILNLLS